MPEGNRPALIDEASVEITVPAKGKRAFSHMLAAMLQAIPTDTQEPVPVSELCLRAGIDPEQEQRSFKAILHFLGPFNVLEITKQPDGTDRAKASSRHALLFIRSYAAYLTEGKSILADWSRGSNLDGPYLTTEPLSGPEFLSLIERQRSADQEDVLTLREASVSKVIIKARVRGVRGHAYLMQFDPGSKQYQLIGGHRRHPDLDDRTTAIRELKEELPRNRFNFEDRDQLSHLGTWTIVAMSRTFGVNTRYHFSFFHLRIPNGQLKLGPGDRWISVDEISAGKTRGRPSIRVAIDAISALDNRLPGGIRELPLSLPEPQRAKLA